MKKQLLACILLCWIAPFLFSQQYSVRRLPTQGKPTVPKAINSNGDVVGYFYIDNTQTFFHPFLWTKSTGTQDLGTLGGDLGKADGINDRGEVVGSAMNDTRMAGFYWSQDTGMRDLGSLTGGDTIATAIR